VSGDRREDAPQEDAVDQSSVELDSDEQFGDEPDEPGVVGPEGRTAVPGARSIRGYTKAVARTRTGAKLGELLDDVYYAVVMVAIGVALAIGAVQQLPVAGAPASGGHATSLGALVLVGVVALAGAVLSLAGRLGPVGVGGAEATWWLGLPVDRRGLLRPTVWRLPALAGLTAALLALVLVLSVPRTPAPALAVTAALLGGTALVVLGGLVQAWRGSRTAVRLGDGVLALAPVAAVVAVLVGWRPAGVAAVPWWVVVALALVLVAASWMLDRRLGALPARSLRESGAVASHATGALASMDSRELGRALTDRVTRQRRGRSRRLRAARGAWRAVAVADWLVLVRSPRHVVQVLAAAALPAVVVSTPELAGSAQAALAVLLGGYVAMLATGEGARRAEMSPALDRLLPLSAKQTRRARLVVPALVMTGWSLLALGAIGVWRGDPLPWLALAVVSGPAWAGAALRAAYRPAPNWAGALVATPLGALPTGAATVVARGPDVAIVGLLPTLIAVALGGVAPVVLAVQAAMTLVALTWGTSLQTKSMFDRLAEATAPEQAPGRARR
jgi:hypothetical protein